MPDPFDHCEALVREAAKDRFLAALFAPLKYRRALFALHAFDIELSRVRDAAREPMPGEIRLQFWRDALGGIQGEAGGHPVVAALRDTVVRYRLPPQSLLAIIDARTFDLYDEPMPSLSDLEAWAMRAHALPLALAAQILCDGRDPQAGALAGHAGIAAAILGAMRRLPVHASRGQIYLPGDVLARHRADPADILAGHASGELRAALAELRLRARQHLDSARALVGSVPPEAAPAFLRIALVRPSLARMERRSYRPFAPPELPQWRRQWILWRAARSGLGRRL